MDDVLADMQADLLKEISAEGHGLEPQPTAAIATATKRITSKVTSANMERGEPAISHFRVA